MKFIAVACTSLILAKDCGADPGYVFLVLTAICNEQQSDPWFIVAVTCMHYVDIPPRRAREREPFIAAE